MSPILGLFAIGGRIDRGRDPAQSAILRFAIGETTLRKARGGGIARMFLLVEKADPAPAHSKALVGIEHLLPFRTPNDGL